MIINTKYDIGEEVYFLYKDEENKLIIYKDKIRDIVINEDREILYYLKKYEDEILENELVKTCLKYELVEKIEGLLKEQDNET